VQTEFKQINPTTQEIILTVETERVDASYQKYLAKQAKQLEVPGFRKGKAPLHMVTRLYSDKLKDYFEKDFVDEVFAEAMKEHDIHFLLYPEVKEIDWQQGSEMKITLEIEHEPKVELKQLDNLRVPFHPLDLEQEVGKFIQNLARENSTIQDVDTAGDGDTVNGHLQFESEGIPHSLGVRLEAGSDGAKDFPQKLVGVHTGDKFERELTGAIIKDINSSEMPVDLEDEQVYPCGLEVSSITRNAVPAIDDEFAKDMDFADLAEMRAKIAQEMKVQVEHRNIEGQNSAILAKLFTDNPFQLPAKTVRYMVGKELEHFEEKFRPMLQQYVIEQVVQDTTSMYLLAALQKQSGLEYSDEMADVYVEHKAILRDINVAAYREENQEIIAGEDFKESSLNYHILRGIAATSEFVEPEPEPQTPEETEFETVESDPDQEEQA